MYQKLLQAQVKIVLQTTLDGDFPESNITQQAVEILLGSLRAPPPQAAAYEEAL
jgi:hypothetical protein